MDYLEALKTAVAYLEAHLGEDVKAEDAARAAGYSYYHLNRQFSAVLGESIGSYLKKRRLANAARQLLDTDRKIIDIALEHGFESPEAFSRAFKAAYRVSPQRYRENRLDLFISAKKRLDTALFSHLAHNVTVHPKIVELPAIRVAGLRGETTLRDNRLPALWARALELAPQIPHRVPGGRGFGICEACRDNTLYTMDDNVLFTEVAGLEVSSFSGLGEPFAAKILPEGRYAVFTHRGTLRSLPQTFAYIWGTWFLTTKEELDGREDFELYDERFLGYDDPHSEMDLYLPLR